MKYALIIIVFLCCVAFGYFLSNKYTKRKKFFSSLISLANKLSLEINFSRERLKVLIENFDDSNKKNLFGVDKKFVDYLDKKSDLNQQELFSKLDFLKNNEKDYVFLFFRTLGRSDVENQTKEIQIFIKRFCEIKDVCDAEQKKYGVLSLKLGVIAGLFFAVIMF